MKVIFTRDSVCMGDDCQAPHEETIDVADSTTLRELLEGPARNYCLRMAGASWIAYRGWNRRDGAPLGMWTEGRSELRLAPGADAVADRPLPPAPPGEPAQFFFEYECRTDPDTLWRTRLAGPR